MILGVGSDLIDIRRIEQAIRLRLLAVFLLARLAHAEKDEEEERALHRFFLSRVRSADASRSPGR